MSYITIYFGDKPVYLCDQLTPEIEQVRHHPEALYIDELSTAAVNSLLHEITKEQFHAGIILGEDFEKLKKLFFHHFKLIQAAGGVVYNPVGQVLLMFRRGKWDLPKGKLDPGETLEECALREVREETGLGKLKSGPLIGITYHTYQEFGKHILKESHWYQMQSLADEPLVPQTEEQITQILWVQATELGPYLDNSFPAISDILARAPKVVLK
ncbi:MAG: NUDIX domain-containing protein [Bacteroidota bacterium]|nr:NUDIX domain-containing protein [Bacteroidota bacterium]